MGSEYITCIDEIFDSLAAAGITRDSNRNWLVEISVDGFSGKLTRMFTCEQPNWDRKIITSVDSYIEYIDEPLWGIKEKGFFKYDFLQEIIDDKNNLIIIAKRSNYEITVEFGDLHAEIPEEDIIDIDS